MLKAAKDSKRLPATQPARSLETIVLLVLRRWADHSKQVIITCKRNAWQMHAPHCVGDRCRTAKACDSGCAGDDEPVGGHDMRDTRE